MKNQSMQDFINRYASVMGQSLVYVGGEFHGPCPLCGGRDRFWIKQGKSTVLMQCRRCEAPFKALIEALGVNSVGKSISPRIRAVPKPKPKQQSRWREILYSHDLVESHPYAERKLAIRDKVKLMISTTFPYEGWLIVPLFAEIGNEREPSEVQVISPTGRKKFIRGAQLSDRVAVLKDVDSETETWVVEGWADAMAVVSGLKAVGAEARVIAVLSVVRMHLARKLLDRKGFPNRVFIFCDGDTVGITKAQKTGVPTIFEHGLDPSDILLRDGPEKIGRMILDARRNA